MSSLMNALGIDRLSVADRVQLAEEILDSLDANREPPALSEDQRRELDRRLADVEANPAALSPWDEVEARVLARLAR